MLFRSADEKTQHADDRQRVDTDFLGDQQSIAPANRARMARRFRQRDAKLADKDNQLANVAPNLHGQAADLFDQLIASCNFRGRLVAALGPIVEQFLELRPQAVAEALQHAGVPIQVDPKNPLSYGQRPAGISEEQQRREFELVHKLDGLAAVEYPDDDRLRARIKAYELAYFTGDVSR